MIMIMMMIIIILMKLGSGHFQGRIWSHRKRWVLCRKALRLMGDGSKCLCRMVNMPLAVLDLPVVLPELSKSNKKTQLSSLF